MQRFWCINGWRSCFRASLNLHFALILWMIFFPDTGGLHLLWGLSVYCRRGADGHRGCHSHRPLLPICEDLLTWDFILPTCFSVGVVYLCHWVDIKGPFLCHSTGALATYALCCNRSRRLYSGEATQAWLGGQTLNTRQWNASHYWSFALETWSFAHPNPVLTACSLQSSGALNESCGTVQNKRSLTAA